MTGVERRPDTERMDAPYERLTERAAAIDELLSDDFEPLPGRAGDADLATRRLAAWCRSSANGDRALFDRRLERDGWSAEHVLARFGAARRKASVPASAWIEDAVWIEAALQGTAGEKQAAHHGADPSAFEHLLFPLVVRAQSLLWADVSRRVFDNFTESARACLSLMLLNELSNLCAPALYERFAKARADATAQDTDTPPRNCRNVALRPVCHGDEGRRLPAIVRGKAGIAAVSRIPHAAVDQFRHANSPAALMSIWRQSAATFSPPGLERASPKSMAIFRIVTMMDVQS